MAVYRQIHTTIWQDDFVGEQLEDPAEKLFWVYLLTSNQTTQCGVYSFGMRQAKFDTGLSGDQIKSTINKLVKLKRIKYSKDNDEILIVNWLKYNSAKSTKVAAVIDKEILNIKTSEFESEVIMACHKFGYPIKTKIKDVQILDRVSQTADRVSAIEDTIPKQNITEQNITEHNRTTGTEEHARTRNPDASATLSKIYQENFGVLSPLIEQELEYSLEDFDGDSEPVIEAMKRAKSDQKGFRYAQGIMKNWTSRNIKTMDQIKADDVRHGANQQRGTKSTKQLGVVPSWMKDAEKPDNSELITDPDEIAKNKQKIQKKLAALKQVSMQKTQGANDE